MSAERMERMKQAYALQQQPGYTQYITQAERDVIWLLARAEAAESALAELRAKVEALAARWIAEEKTYAAKNGFESDYLFANNGHTCAADITALLGTR